MDWVMNRSAAFVATFATVATLLSTSAIARTQLDDSETELNVSDKPTTDPAHLTPIPIEFPDAGEHLPDWLDLKLPFEGKALITNGYGYESQIWTHQTINNTMSANDFFCVDFNLPKGTPILAPADGRIITAQDRSHRDGYGIYIVIDHGQGYRTILAHLSDVVTDPISEPGEPTVWVQHGDPELWVKQGDLIAHSGDTGMGGAHLHFGMHRGSFLSESGCDISGKVVVPEPVSGYYGLRVGHLLLSDNVATGVTATTGPKK
jgi:murein DD-endopeptidase MepM/ murein hydrolase activator NlpD